MPLNLDYTYKTKAKSILDEYNKILIKKDIEFKEYDNATVFPLVKYNDYNVMFGRGGVIDSTGNYVEESGHRNRAIGLYEFETPAYEDKRVVFCGFFVTQWGHFITESVSRLWYALKDDEKVDEYVFIYNRGVDYKLNNNFKMFMDLLGIGDKVRIITEPIKFKSVVIPEIGYDYGRYYTNEFLDMYEKVICEAKKSYNGPYYDKVFCTKSRLPGSVMMELNSKKIDKFFRVNDFKIISPEKLSLIELIGIIQGCSVWGALDSSASHNALFAKKEQTVLALEKQAFFNPYQIHISKMKDYDAVFIDAFNFLLPVDTYGPFWLDYSFWLDKFAENYNYKKIKKDSVLKSKIIFKRYINYYFNMNSEMPPDWVYLPSQISNMREAYNDTFINKRKILDLSYKQRLVLKIKKYIKKRFN